MTNIRDRAIGAFIGLAVGDAVGTTNEFLNPWEFEPITDMVGDGFFKLEPGQWTDDTSMALCLADTILETGTVDPEDLMRRFCRWYKYGYNSSNGECFDIGTTTVKALRKFIKTQNYKPASKNPKNSGNGSIMRLAPVVTRWWNSDKLEKMAILQSSVTHNSELCLNQCAFLAQHLGMIIRGEEYEKFLFDEIEAFNPPNSGYVLDTMVSAIWAFETTDNFRDCILKAANLGGDADTIAAVSGQLAGAKYGLSGIPMSWTVKLTQFPHIYDLADQLWNASLTN